MTDQIKITVIATGFDTEDLRSKLGISAEAYTKDSLEMSRPIVASPHLPPSIDSEEEDLDEANEIEEEESSDSWGKPKMNEDPENKYDIPAFLRGK